MKLILSLVAAGCFLAGGAFGETFNGYISGSHCGAKHSSPSAANTKCIKKCMKGGAEAVLVRNGQVIQIAAKSQKKAKKHAGQDVTINGTEANNMITIKSIHKASASSM